LIPTVINYISRVCPICFSLKSKLKMLEIEGKIRLLEVDVQAVGGGELLDRYHYFIKRVLGGSVEVPVVLLLDVQKWYVPTQRTKLGEKTSFSGVVEVSVTELLKELIEDIKKLKPRPEPHPTHAQMIEITR